MHVCGQTLVLVDNDATVSAVNQKLAKATLKYMFYHMPENRTFCLSTYEHDIISDEAYTSEVNDLVCSADKLEFEPKDSDLTDTLTEVISRWKASDFACRDIVVFTDGLEGGPLYHEKEEMYYLLENSGYPVYIVMLDQENNASSKKTLSAIAVTSGGKLYESEFEGSDAEVDRQLTEMIYSAMDEYALIHWGQYEEDAEDTAGNETAEEDEEYGEEEIYEADAENYASEGFSEERVVYEYEKPDGFFRGTGAFILGAAIILAGLLAGVLGGLVIMKRKRAGYVPPVTNDDDDYFDDYELAGPDTDVLSEDGHVSEGATRLLSENCRVVCLTDSGGSGRRFRLAITAPMSIGRGDCDVKITGDDALSKRHCELYENGNDVYVRDLSSANGTRVNGVKVEKEKLSEGDELTIGTRTYVVGFE